MDIEPKEVDLQLYSKAMEDQVRRSKMPEQIGHPQYAYKKQKGKYSIRIEAAQASKAEGLVAAIAHELGHVILIGENRLDRARADHEEMADLLTVFYGIGVFTANSAVALAEARNTKYEGGPHLRDGYMTEEMYGYALALFVHARGESKPKWTQPPARQRPPLFQAGTEVSGQDRRYEGKAGECLGSHSMLDFRF